MRGPIHTKLLLSVVTVHKQQPLLLLHLEIADLMEEVILHQMIHVRSRFL